MPRRLLGVLASTALAVAASGCTADSGTGAEAPSPRGCGECAAELDDLTSTLEALDDVESVEMATFDADTDDRGQLYVQLTVAAPDLASADTAAIADELTRAAWDSDLQPLDRSEIVFTLGSGYYESAIGDFGRERTTYEERWGPRPAGTVWSAVPDDDPREGCSPCVDETRELARQIDDLPGVGTVTEARWASDPVSGESDLTVAFTTDGPADPMDQVIELVWRSAVTPLDDVRLRDASSKTLDPVSLDLRPDSADSATYEERWGPRSARRVGVTALSAR